MSNKSYQGKSAQEWATIANKAQHDNYLWKNEYNKKVGSLSAELNYYKNLPTPTPQIIYKIQYQTQYVPTKTSREPVTYTPIGNDAMGSDGSFCYPIGNTMHCQ